MRQNLLRSVERCMLSCLVIVTLAWSLFPIMWMLRISLMHKIHAFTLPPPVIFKMTFDHFRDIFGKSFFGGRLYQYYLNSLIVASGSTSLSVFMGCLGGYSLSRYRFAGDKFLAFSILASRMLPPVAFIVPLFFMIRNWGLYDTHLGLILIYTAFHAPFATWMMKAFIDEVPREIEESAMVDGCSRVGSFFRTTLPLAAPGFAATAVYNFILSWNEFLFALVFTSTTAKTISVAAIELVGEAGVEWGPMAAMGAVSMIPAVIFTLISQKYLVKGLTLGAVKG